MDRTLREALQSLSLRAGDVNRLEAVLCWLSRHGLTYVVDLSEAEDPRSWDGADEIHTEDMEVVIALQEVRVHFKLCCYVPRECAGARTEYVRGRCHASQAPSKAVASGDFQRAASTR